MSKPSLVVLAAGIGSRYGGFKQIDPIGPNGEILLDYSIYDALRAGFGRIVLIVRPELEPPMREHFAGTLGDALEMAYAFQRLDDLPPGSALAAQRSKPWGTAQAVWAAREAVAGQFGVINADDFYGPESYQVLARSLASQAPGEYSLVGFELARTLSEHGSVSRGVCRSDADGFLIEVVERTKIEPDPRTGARVQISSGDWEPLAPDSIASMNMWGFDVTLMGHLERVFSEFLAANGSDTKAEFYIPTAVDTLIREGRCRCRVLRTPEQWFGMTNPQDRAFVAQGIGSLIASGRYPHRLIV